MAGTIGHGAVVTVPWGTTADWNIFVSPNSMGQEEPNSEFDNAMLMLECSATQSSTTTWTIKARYKFKFSNAGDTGNGQWFDGTANYLLVPK